MSNILVICPTHRDYREIALLHTARRHRFFFHDYASLALEDLVAEDWHRAIQIADPRDEIRHLVERYADAGIDAVVSTDDYPGSALASILAERFGLPGPAPSVNLRCQHKYYSRVAQRSLVPQAVPHFRCFDSPGTIQRDVQFPAFLKPVKSFFSVGAYPVNSMDELARCMQQAALPRLFFRPFSVLLKEYADLALGPTLLIEDFLQGRQATLEGYVYRGEFHMLGVVDSIMHPGTISFQRFEYPSSLPGTVQARMGRIAKRVMGGLRFNNGLFNIEFMHNPVDDSLHIIEINPRMASQFADLYEKVDGTNSYQIMLDVALGRTPSPHRRKGRYAFAASCVLRLLNNALVVGLPSPTEIQRVQHWYPDCRIEILATAGRYLSQDMQDGHSYRYGVINLGGRNRQDILSILEHCLSGLTFTFQKVRHHNQAVNQ